MLTISAKPEPLDDDDDELELPRLPAVLDDPLPDEPDPEDPDEPEPLELELELEFEPPEISSPGLVLSSETIVPVAGAYSLVSASAA